MRMPHGAASETRRLIDLARHLPDQFRDGFRAGRAAAPVSGPPGRVVLLGMGGSAIAGDLAAVLTDPETAVALSVVRGAALPRAWGAGTLALVASYSGNTRETLEMFEEAGRRGMGRIVLTSGGELAERAGRAQVPVVTIPAGGPPRAWVGFTLGALLGILDAAFPRPNAARVERAARDLERRIGGLRSLHGGPERWARDLGDRRVAVYAETNLAGLAVRWKSQIEENAKRPAEYGIMPETFHNSLVAWDAVGRIEGRLRGVVLLTRAGASPEEKARHRYLLRLLKERGVPRIPVELPGLDPLLALLAGISMGDFFSLALARRAGIDPFPITAIDRMKDELVGKVARRPARRPDRSGRPSPRP